MRRMIGFALTELLRVISILALLAAVLFPVFATAQEKTKQATCASNLQQLGSAFAQYQHDYDGSMPTNLFPSGTSASTWAVGWANELYPYVKSSAVFACPEDAYIPASPYNQVSYAMNTNVMQAVTIPPAFTSVNPYAKLSNLTSPALTVLLFEVGRVNNVVLTDSTPAAGTADSPTGVADSFFMNGYDLSCSDNQALYATGQISPVSGHLLQTISTSDGIGARHAGASNFLAVDGHVKLLRPDQVSGGFTASSAASAENPVFSYGDNAAGTANMQHQGGGVVTLTFSPV